jgi:hypothetical protein
MKKFFLAVIASIMLASFEAALAQTPSDPPPTVTSAEEQPAQADAEQSAPKLPSPADFLDSIIAYVEPAKEYSVKFSLIQPLQPAKKLDDDKRDALRNEFSMKYGEKEDGWLMRLEALRGHHQNTVVVHKKDAKAGDYKYYVYKPAGLTILPKSDPRVRDIPGADYRTFLKNLRASIDGANALSAHVEGMKSTNEVLFEFLPATGSYIMQVTGELSRTVNYFSGNPILLTRQDLYVKKGKELLFKRTIEWREFAPGEQKEAALTAVPSFKKK